MSFAESDQQDDALVVQTQEKSPPEESLPEDSSPPTEESPSPTVATETRQVVRRLPVIDRRQHPPIPSLPSVSARGKLHSTQQAHLTSIVTPKALSSLAYNIRMEAPDTADTQSLSNTQETQLQTKKESCVRYSTRKSRVNTMETRVNTMETITGAACEVSSERRCEINYTKDSEKKEVKDLHPSQAQANTNARGVRLAFSAPEKIVFPLMLEDMRRVMETHIHTDTDTDTHTHTHKTTEEYLEETRNRALKRTFVVFGRVPTATTEDSKRKERVWGPVSALDPVLINNRHELINKNNNHNSVTRTQPQTYAYMHTFVIV
eukprot:GHVR01121951.1.p1 GENE.GHVR01121951.1~~GHVR01121951.1.p1  ORF type:complete len:320 (-),score=85.27 GHVR01121951.1:279-1238(-)